MNRVKDWSKTVAYFGNFWTRLDSNFLKIGGSGPGLWSLDSNFGLRLQLQASNFWLQIRLQNALIHWKPSSIVLFVAYNLLSPQTRGVELEPDFQEPAPPPPFKSIWLQLQPLKMFRTPSPGSGSGSTALIRLGSDWENFSCSNVFILNISKLLVAIRFCRIE